MVQVCVKQSGDTIYEIGIHDHAGYAPKGQDLVCAGVSAIAVGMMNALDKISSTACNMQMKEAFIDIQVIQPENRDVQVMLKAMLTQLETMRVTYDTFIKISYQEV